jgi:hypothetical protein
MTVERRARRMLRWYPKTWRETHDEEFRALLEDSMIERPFSPGRSLNVIVNALRLRSVELRFSSRRLVLTISAPLVALGAALGLAINGLSPASDSGPTRRGMPSGYGPGFVYAKIPDYLAVSIGSNETGYTPKAYLVARGRSSEDPFDGRIAPVYASDLMTLLGHLYPGVGYVRLGTSPWTLPCLGEEVGTTNANGTRTIAAIACPLTLIVLPNVVGMSTPTATAMLSSLGIGVVVQNVQTSLASPGHIVVLSPIAGSIVHARQQVIVENSIPN